MSKLRPRATAALAVVALAMGALAAGAPAATAADNDGLWYYDLFGFGATHNSGITGAGVTIAILDTPINPAAPSLVGADVQVQETSCFDEAGAAVLASSTGPEATHATAVASFIVGNGANVKGVAPDATVLLFPVLGPRDADGYNRCFDADGSPNRTADVDAVEHAIEAGVDIISVSANLQPVPELIAAFALAQSKGIVILGSVENSSEIGDAFEGDHPAQTNGAVGVQRIDVNGDIGQTDGEPNANALTDVVGPGTGLVIEGVETGGVVDWNATKTDGAGTSYATPIVAGMLALVKQKYPDATGNQLIQSLIRNTGAEDHELIYDNNYLTGYGVASATHMLKVDPTQYEDVNPLLIDGDGFLPPKSIVDNPDTIEDWLASLTGETAGPADLDDGDDPSGDSGFPLILLVILIGVAVLVVVGAVILIIVLASRRSRGPTTHEGAGQ